MTIFYFLDFGGPLLEHVLLGVDISPNGKFGKDIDLEKDLDKIMEALEEAQKIMNSAQTIPIKVI